MADKTVGQLPALGAFGDDILIPVQDTGVAKRATGAQIKQFALDAVAPSVQEVEAIAAEMRQQAASPFLIAATAAAMTDRTKAYVYTGSESGYTNGAWYYWAGSAWTMGGTAADPTLSVSGAAADSKAVGEAIEASRIVEDEYGSAYTSATEMQENLRAAEETPVYKYCFADMQAGYYNNSGVWVGTSGLSTVNRPVPYDDSMVLVFRSGSVASSCYLYGGHLEDGAFVPDKVTYYGTTDRKAVPVRALRGAYKDLGVTHVAFGANGTAFPFDAYIKSPRTKLARAQAITLVNSTVEKYLCNASHNITYYSDADGAVRELSSAARYLYAGGLPIDAKFYKLGTDGTTQTLIQDSVGDLGAASSSLVYPCWIKVPEGATGYRLAVYGFRRTSVRYLGSDLMEYLPEICVYYEAQHAPVPRYAVGQAIKNAQKLAWLRYPAGKLVTKDFSLVPADTVTFPVDAQFRGLPYGKNPIGYYCSYYTYLSSYRFFANGVAGNTANGGALRTDANSYFGMTCTAFLSAVLGLPENQGTEWFLQTYGDRMVKMQEWDAAEVGDVIVRQTYEDPPRLNTHIRLVLDRIYDRETGEFVAYLVAESANIWTRVCPMRFPRDAADCWIIPLPLASVPDITKSYRYEVDRTLDTLNNAMSLTFPPVVTYYGDMVLLIPYGSGYTGVAMNNTLQFCFDKTGTTGRISKDGAQLDTFTVSALEGYDASNAYCNRAHLRAYFTDASNDLIPGVYTVELDGSTKPCTFRIPVLPEVSLSANERTLTITSLGTFDEIWLRVIPEPAAVDGYPNGTPYCNYMTLKVPASAITAGTYTLPEGYARITRAVFVDNRFGAIVQTFSGDYTGSSDDEDD